MTMRAASQADLDRIALLEKASFPEPWNRAMIAADLRGPNGLNFVVEKEGEVIGYLLATRIIDEIHIHKIGVAPAWRRQGVASSLMQVLVERAHEMGCSTMTLEVREPNHPARRFYERLGFRTEYRRPRYYPNGDDAIVMSRGIRQVHSS
jgi:[ribosomal protein S18]-alanine N-acetyltransferase